MPVLYTSAGTTGGDVWQMWSALSYATTATTTASTWKIWNESARPISYATSDPWGAWNATSTLTTATTGNSITWSNWIHAADQPRVGRSTVHRPAPTPVDPAVEAAARAEQERQAEEWRRRDREAVAAKARASERAMQLLTGVLNEAQKKDLAANGYFFVDAPSGRRYRIDKGRSGNVKVVDKVTGQWTESLCIHQRDDVPLGDTMLMQKLLIETAEETFRSYANITVKDGTFKSGKRGLLTGEELENVIPFPALRERQAAAA